MAGISVCTCASRVSLLRRLPEMRRIRQFFVRGQAMSSTFSSRRILIADDQHMMATAVERMIQVYFKCSTVVVHSGDDALRVLAAEPFDVFVTDMLMPGLNGLALVRAVRRDHPGVDVLITTAHPESFPYLDSIAAGAADYIVRPHTPEELQAKVLRLLEQRAERERDLEERNRLMAALRAGGIQTVDAVAEGRYQQLFEMSNTPMLILGDDFTVETANAAFARLVAREPADLVKLPLFGLVGDSDVERLRTGLAFIAKAGHGTLSDIMMLRGDATPCAVDLSVAFIRGTAGPAIYLTCRDVTEQRAIEDGLLAMAHRDELTGLCNQRSFMTRVENVVERAAREGAGLSLLCIDIDNFKQCNDTFGHQAGDRLLRLVGRLIQKHSRTGVDEGFRIGGDEFAVVLWKADASAGKKVAARLSADLCADGTHGATLSIGIAQFEPGMTAATWREAADKALYLAKSRGKNTICVA